MNPDPEMVTAPPPDTGPRAGVTEVMSGTTKVNIDPATAGEVPAATPVVVTVTTEVRPDPTDGVITVIDVLVADTTDAGIPSNATVGLPEPNPDPEMVTNVPPVAGPKAGFSPVTVGQPAEDPDNSPSSAPARGLPHPEARSYPLVAGYFGLTTGTRALFPTVTSLNEVAAPDA